VEVHLLPHGPLRIVNISGSGVLIEHEQPLRFGQIYQAELRHAERRVRLRVR